MDIDKIKRLLSYRKLFQNTTDDDWTTNTVVSDCGTKRCALGHLYNHFNGVTAPKMTSSSLHRQFLFPIFHVNDARLKYARDNYPQDTPRARVLAYIDDEIAFASGCERAIKKFQDMMDHPNN